MITNFIHSMQCSEWLRENQWPPKQSALHFCLTFTHSLIHSYTDGSVSHARRHPARREQLYSKCILFRVVCRV